MIDFSKVLPRWKWMGNKTLLIVLLLTCGCKHTLQLAHSNIKSWSDVSRADAICMFFYNDNASALQEAIDMGMPVHNLYGCNGNSESVNDVVKPRGETYDFFAEAAPLLFDAINYSATNCAMCLLKNGANPRVCTSDGRSIFHACASLHGETLMQFMDLFFAGYHMRNEMNTQNAWGKTPLHSAIRVGNLDMVRFLVENGVDYRAKYRVGIRMQDKRMCPIIFWAVFSESDEVFEYILNMTPSEDLWCGADRSILSSIDVRDGQGQSRFSKLAPLVLADRERMLGDVNVYVKNMKRWGDCEKTISFLNGFDFPAPYLEAALEYAKVNKLYRSARLLEAKLVESRQI